MTLIFNPRQTILISCAGPATVLGKRVEDQEEIIPLDWHSPASHEPPLYAIFLSKQLCATEIIRESQVFAVNFMAYLHKDKVLRAGLEHGEFTKKFESIGFTRQTCEKIDCPKIGEALGHLECEVQHEIDCGDHVLFLGKVVWSELHRKEKRLFHVDADEFTTTMS
ncbi:flavin reductase family protein [Candidatus Woesearchaeota archaeon]|nr:flavin reductase family protein [Candidatus Woesearchaeota archaeon]